MEHLMTMAMALTIRSNFYIFGFCICAIILILAIAVNQWQCYGLEKTCEACGQKAHHLAGGLVMDYHGFICNDCLYSNSEPEHEHYGYQKTNWDALVEEMDTKGIAVEDYFDKEVV